MRSRREWFFAAVAAGIVVVACTPFRPSADLEAYRMMTQNRQKMARAEALSPYHFQRSQNSYWKATWSCTKKQQQACDKYSALARKHLTMAMEESRSFDADPGVSTEALEQTTTKQLKQRLRKHEARVRALESLHASARTARHRQTIEGVLDRERAAVWRIDDVLDARTQFAQLQQQQQRRRQQAAVARMEREKQALFVKAKKAFGAAAVQSGPEGVAIIFHGLFAPNSATLEMNRARRLHHVVSLADEYPRLPILVEGHTDGRGNAMDNDALSLMRAKAVKAYLAARGVFDDRILAVGHGSFKPIANNTTARGRATNRRIAIIFAP